MNRKGELLEFCKKNSTVIIYGAGRFGKSVERFLSQNSISIFCFCVTQIDEKETFLGYPVKEIEEIQRDFKEAGIIVAVSEKFSEAILEKVTGMQYFYDKDLLLEIDLDYVWKEAEERTKQVKVENNMLCSVGEYSFRKDTTYIFCPGSIGDTLYIASLVKEYKKRNGINSAVLIVKKNQESIADLFPSIDGCIVSNELVEVMDLYFKSKLIWELDNYLYGFAREDLAHHSCMHPCAVKNLLSGYKTLIMGLDEEAEYEEMEIDRDKPVADVYNKRTIIVMPHETSARRLPLSFWEELCEELNKNYTVYTNTKDKTELPIKGTKVISESLKDMTNICEHCFAVISIRTGMCDLLAFTKSNLIVLNTELELAEKWNLKKVFKRDNLVNIDCYDEFEASSLKENIMSQLKKFG